MKLELKNNEYLDMVLDSTLTAVVRYGKLEENKNKIDKVYEGKFKIDYVKFFSLMGYETMHIKDIVNYLYTNDAYIEFDYLNNRMTVSLVDEYSNEKIYSHQFLGEIYKFIVANQEINV